MCFNLKFKEKKQRDSSSSSSSSEKAEQSKSKSNKTRKRSIERYENSISIKHVLKSSFKLNMFRENKENKEKSDKESEEVQSKDNSKQSEPEDIYCTINKEEVPPVPANSFLMRQTIRSGQDVPSRNVMRNNDRSSGRKKDSEGRRVKGRGALVILKLKSFKNLNH